MISIDDIKHIAKLSKLELSDSEIEKYQIDLGDVVDYVNTLSKIDTSSVQAKEQVISLNELRLDEIKPSLTQEEALFNAPKKRNGGFSVPAVIE